MLIMDAMAPKGKCHFLLTENTVRNITSFLQDRWNQYLQPLHSDRFGTANILQSHFDK